MAEKQENTEQAQDSTASVIETNKENTPPQAEQAQDSTAPVTIPQVRSSRQMDVLMYSGLIFLASAVISLIFIGVHVTRVSGFPPYGMKGGGDPNMLVSGMIDYYLSIFMIPIILLIAAVLSSVVGYILLRAAGTVSDEVIPQKDSKLLTELLRAEKEKAIDLYIRLSGLKGTTGFFTKIGLSGLPLATIFLTLVFTSLSVLGSGFFDLAKLTLGVFLGSYVQRHADIRDQ